MAFTVRGGASDKSGAVRTSAEGGATSPFIPRATTRYAYTRPYFKGPSLQKTVPFLTDAGAGLASVDLGYLVKAGPLPVLFDLSAKDPEPEEIGRAHVLAFDILCRDRPGQERDSIARHGLEVFHRFGPRAVGRERVGLSAARGDQRQPATSRQAASNHPDRIFIAAS